MIDPIIEVCANSAASCVAAERGGAYRVELCGGIPEGGTTPSVGEVLTARRATKLKINAIIRPRGGDFCYSDLELEAMLCDIQAMRASGVDGVVFGCLLADGSIDMVRNAKLMAAAKGLSTTFHRAFDVCADPFAALEQIIEMGFDRILTSGQQPSAEEGADMLQKLVKAANNRIVIMPGCGVNENNIASIAKATGAKEFHSSAREKIASKMQYKNEKISMGGTVVIDEYALNVTSSQRVCKMINALKNV
ncbi:MAG: copper homeostasis protein CutC [Mucinivorans sp.]